MKLYPYPKRQMHLKKTETSKGRPEVYWDHSTRVIRWMGRNALRRIHEVLETSGRMPTVDELEGWIMDHPGKAKHEFFDKVEDMAESAAVFALGAYDADEWARRVRRASNGGTKSRRGATYTTDQLAAVDGLSIAEQAKALGCTTRTVSRLRARVKPSGRTTTVPENADWSDIDALLPVPDAVVAVDEPAIEPVDITDLLGPAPVYEAPTGLSYEDDVETAAKFWEIVNSRLTVADFITTSGVPLPWLDDIEAEKPQADIGAFADIFI